MSESSPLNDPLLASVPVHEGYKVLGDVALYTKLGQGGMGAVYKGHHVRLHNDVAVKIMVPPAGISLDRADAYVQRFIREARTAAKIDHPNLIRVTDVNAESGVYFLVMQFVDGESAAARLKRKGPLSEAEALQIILGAAEGLAAAHRAGIVHRDVKPDNIMIDREGAVKVADLGLAKAFQQDEQKDEPTLTHTQQAMGTPSFMSPEQIEDFKHVGPPSDVWSLGITLYQLLAEKLPFAESQIHRLFSKICDEPMPEIKELRPELSDFVFGFIEKATRKDPAERYADAGELAADLRDHQQSAAQPKPTLDDFSAADFHRGTPQASPPPEESLIVIASQIDSSSPSTSESARESADEPPAAREKEEVVESLIPEYELQPLFQSPSEREEDEVEERSSSALRETRPTLSTVAPARRIEVVAGIGAIVIGIILAALVVLRGGDSDQKEQKREPAEQADAEEERKRKKLAASAGKNLKALKIQVSFMSGRRANGKIDPRDANLVGHPLWQNTESGVEIRMVKDGNVGPYSNIEGVEILEGVDVIDKSVTNIQPRKRTSKPPTATEVARAWGIEEITVAEPAYEPPSTEGVPSGPPSIGKPMQEDGFVSAPPPKPDDAYAYFQRGVAKRTSGDSEDAIAKFTKAIELKPAYAEAYSNRGGVKLTSRDYKGAIADFTRAIELKPNEVVDYLSRGYAKLLTRDYRGTIVDYTKSIELMPESALPYRGRGFARHRSGDYRGAIADYTKAIELKPNFAITHYNRGHAKKDIQDYKGAVLDFTRAIELKPDYAEAYIKRGIAKMKSGNYQGAIADYTKAIEFKPDDALAYNNRGIAKYRTRDYEGAITDFGRAIQEKPDMIEAYSWRGATKSMMGMILKSDHHFKDAIEDYSAIIGFDRNNASAHAERAMAKLKLEDFNSALSDIEKAVKLDPANGERFAQRGEVKSARGDLRGAMEDYDVALKLLPRDEKDSIYSVYLDRGNLRLGSGDARGAIREYDELIKLEPDSFIGYISRARAKRDAGDVGGSISDFRIAGSKSANNKILPWVGEEIIRSAEKSVKKLDWDAAIRFYKLAIELKTETHKAHLGLQRALLGSAFEIP